LRSDSLVSNRRLRIALAIAAVLTAPPAESQVQVVPRVVTERSLNKIVDNSALGSFLVREGFSRINLEQRNLNPRGSKHTAKQLTAAVEVNGLIASMVVDTGASKTSIARGRLTKFDLSEQKTNYPAASTFGGLSPSEFVGFVTLNTLGIGNCLITNLPVHIFNLPRDVDGLLGLDAMRRTGAVIDCADRALYVTPQAPSSDTSDRLTTILRDEGYTSIRVSL